MAKWNPEIQSRDPKDYLGASRAIDPISPDKTGEEVLKGLGNIVEVGIKGADTVVKEKLYEEIYAKADTQRQVQTAGLEQVQKSGQPQNILTPQGDDIPEGLAHLEQNVGSLHGAMGSGKISNMAYWGRLNELAKGLRTQYPGYKDYIDTTISQITGHNPANQYLTSLVSEINRSQSTLNADRNKIASLFSTHIRVPGVAEMRSQWEAGNKTNQEVFAFISKNLEHIHRKEVSEANMTIYNNNASFVASESSKIADAEAGIAVDNYLSTVTLPNGEKAREYIGKVQRGEIRVGDDQAREFGTILRSYRTQADAAVWAGWQVANKDGVSMVDRLGGAAKAREKLDVHMKSFDKINEDVYNNQFGIAFINKNFVAAKLDSATAHMISDTSVGDFAIKLGVTQKLAGPNYVKDLVTLAIGDGIATDLQGYFSKKALDLHIQTDPNKPQTFDKAIKEAKTFGVGDPKRGRTEQEGATFYSGILKQVTTLTNPKAPDELKKNIAKAAFDPANREMLNNFVRDNIDPQTRQPVPGQYAVFRMFANAAITKEIVRLSESDPQLLINYKDWVNTSFGRILFRNDIIQLNEVKTHNLVSVGWDTEKVQWTSPKIIPSNRTLGRDFHTLSVHMTRAQRTVDELNEGLRIVKSVAEATGEDPNAYVGQQMLDAGLDFKSVPTSLTGAMLEAWLTANRKEQEQQKAPQKPAEGRTERRSEAPRSSTSQFTPPERTVSLGDWLKNPTAMTEDQFREQFLSTRPDVVVGNPTTKGKDQGRVKSGDPYKRDK